VGYQGQEPEFPLYHLLGGRFRDRVLVYGHAAERSDETVEAVGKYMQLGYKAIRAQSGVPGMKSTMAWDAEICITSRPKKNARRKSLVDRAYLNFAHCFSPNCARSFGSDIHLLHDAHHRLSPIEAARTWAKT